MTIFRLNALPFRVIFNSNIRQILLVNGYKTATKPRFDNYQQRNEKRSDGFVSESSWFNRREVDIKPESILSGAKITDQPVTVECDNLDFQTWQKFPEIPNLDTRLYEVLVAKGRIEMSPIQRYTFDILNRRLLDLLGSAETGSGKTLAFLVPILNNMLSTYPKELMEELKMSDIQTPMMLVMAPTRELVQQISTEARMLMQMTPLRVCDVIGGVNITSQMGDISSGCHSIIATPGRLMDLLSRGTISLKYCKSVVLDEADRMLDMGFEPQIRRIMSNFDMPDVENRQTSMFSATFPKDVMTLARSLLSRKYGKIMVGLNAGSRDPTVPETITQSFILSRQPDIFTELFKILMESTKKTIVFCNTKRDVESVERIAFKRGLGVAMLYGDLNQGQRDKQLNAFKTNKVKILIATSVAARGIDVADVELVVNYGCPTTRDEYVHRVGRCGRMGRPGEAVTLVTGSQLTEGSIARDLVTILKKTKQIVPKFLEGIAPGEVRKYGPKKDFGSKRHFN